MRKLAFNVAQSYSMSSMTLNMLCSTHLSVLSQLELHGTGNLLHGLGLGSGSDTGHGQTDVDGGADAWQ